jgi:CheY-like chemotaxis protein
MKTILLADDSVTIQKVVELTFSDVPGETFSVVTASNGDEAIRMLLERRPDVVIADVHMPGADGFEVCRRARQLRPPVPVLLLVGAFEPFDPDQATRAGAEGFLKKPFDSQELLRRVQEIAARAQEIPAAPSLSEEGEVRPFEEPLWVAETTSTSATSSELNLASPGVGTPRELEIGAPTTPLQQPLSLAPKASSTVTAGGLTEADIDRIARRVVELLSEKVVREVAWEVVPDLAEIMVKDRIREIEAAAD